MDNNVNEISNNNTHNTLNPITKNQTQAPILVLSFVHFSLVWLYNNIYIEEVDKGWIRLDTPIFVLNYYYILLFVIENDIHLVHISETHAKAGRYHTDIMWNLTHAMNQSKNTCT